jgi:Xaa-Pro aminopeptidase
MRREDIACLLVSSVLNHAVRYLGFFDSELQGRGSGSPQVVSALLPLEGEPVLFIQTFTAASYMLPRAKSASCIDDVRLVGGGNQHVLELVAEQLKGWKLDRTKLGLAGDEIDWAERLFFPHSLPDCTLVDANRLLNELRIVKEPEEIELMRRSAAIGDAAMEEVQKSIAPGMTDYEIYSVGECAMRRQGGTEESFVLLGIGPSDNPMLMKGLNGFRLKKGDVLVYETLPFYHDYNTELAVTFSIGKPSEDQSRAATACQVALDAGMAEIKPGVHTAAVVESSLKQFRKYGWDSYTHTPGHFMGLDNYEGPSLRNPDLVLEPGMIFSFHPNVVVANKVTEEICAIVLVTEKGLEVLNKFQPMGIRVI